MVSIGPPGSCCFISSIVELPLFYEVGATLYGTMFGVTNEIYEPMQFEVRQNRDLEIVSGFTKYKIELSVNGEIYDVIGIALQPFNPNAILSEEFARIPFYPIYYHHGKDCILFIEAINDLFQQSHCISSAPGSDKVISAMDVIKHIDQYVRPTFRDEWYDCRFARLGMTHRLLEFIMMEMSPDCDISWSDETTTLRINYGMPNDYVPLAIQMFSNVRVVAQLRQFLNPYGSIPSDIAVAAMTTVQNNFNQIKQDLIMNDALPDKVGDIFMTEAEDFSYTGKWLSLIYQHEYNNFQFFLRQDYNNVSDMYLQRCHEYDHFRHSFHRMSSWNDLSACMLHSLQLYNNLQSGDLTVQRSWLEDVVIRNSNGIIVMYADMVLLILMCAEGLINQCIVDQINMFH